MIGLNNGLSLIWHLGMSGRVKISDLRPDVLDKHDHVIIETSNGTLTYNDARRFGLLIYCPTAEVVKIPYWAIRESTRLTMLWTALICEISLKAKQIPIKIALLDQKVISGIGNIYASEALFGAGILPTREANALTDSEYNLLVTEIRKVLEKAIQAGGSTLRDYRKPDGSLGYFQNEHCVYNKTGQRCPGCTCSPESGGGIRKITQAGRSTFYCPTKQK